MASLYQRNRSPFWWIKYRDPRTNLLVRESTNYRVGVGADTRRARELEAAKTLAERQAPASKAGNWEGWVTDFINQQTSGRTRERYLSTWRTLRMFFDDHAVGGPQALTYQICSAYLPWREQPNAQRGKYRAGRNTAILEFKVVRWLMREAVKRGYCQGNPAREVVLKRAPIRVFPDYTDAQLQQIAKAIDSEPEPARTLFKRSFAIALLHGVRLAETNVNPMADLNLAGEFPTIRFFQKGGKERWKPLHPQLLPLLRKLRAAKATQCYPLKRSHSGRWMWGGRWTKFFERHGISGELPNACFHSLRVTVENVLREARIAKEIREAYLSHEHGSADINAGYDRIKVREMLACHAPLQRDWLPSWLDA